MAEDCCSFQLIRGNGDINIEGLENFKRITNLSRCGHSYAVVAIIGPQSSGKSTLLNQLFQTNFRTMDAYGGRVQTTQGIWIAKGIGIEPYDFTIATDVEGSDSKERGEDDVTFEKQSAVFALAIADVVIINMWCHDIGREQAGSRPHLKAVFQARARLFDARKTTLLFVIRDPTKTPLKHLERALREDIMKIWAATAKPEAPLDEFFNVKITALANYESEEKKFNKQVPELRQLLFQYSIYPGDLTGDRKDVQPASGLLLRAKQIWETIKKDRDLNLPSLKELIAKFRCEEIAEEKLSRLKETLSEMSEALKSGRESEPGEKLSSILENCLRQYDKEAVYYEERIRKDRRQQLKKKALKAKERFLRDIETFISEKKAKKYEAQEKCIKTPKIKTLISTGAQIVVGVGVGMAMAVVMDPITATATGLGASATIKKLIDLIY